MYLRSAAGKPPDEVLAHAAVFSALRRRISRQVRQVLRIHAATNGQARRSAGGELVGVRTAADVAAFTHGVASLRCCGLWEAGLARRAASSAGFLPLPAAVAELVYVRQGY